MTTTPDAQRGPVQDLLFRATFLPGDAGLAAFRGWKATVDLDGHLELGSYRLLPELTRRLRLRGIEDPLLDKFAGVSRKHWLANRILFNELEPLLTSFKSRGVRVMVPGGMALALAHLPDYALDPFLNCGLVVRADQAVTAFDVLEAEGWIPTPRVGPGLLDRYVSARSWHPFRAPGGDRCRLHWHVLPRQQRPAVDQALWSRATERSIGDVTVAVLSPTDQFVQLCAQRVAWSLAPIFVRAVDVMLLMSACPDRIDWEVLMELSAVPGLILPIRDTLSYLQDRLDRPVPTHVFRRIQGHHVSQLERLDHEMNGRRASRMGNVLGLWLDYRRRSSANALVTALQFPRFLQHYLKLPHVWQTPFRALARATGQRLDETGEALSGGTSTNSSASRG